MSADRAGCARRRPVLGEKLALSNAAKTSRKVMSLATPTEPSAGIGGERGQQMNANSKSGACRHRQSFA
jgi:hypothetical protein